MPALSGGIGSGVWPAVTAFGRWWFTELRSLLPSRFTLRIGSLASRADIRPGRTAVEIVRVARGEGERFVEGKPLAAFDEENWAETASLIEGHRTRVLLARPSVHVLTLQLPRAARAHLRSAIPLQLRDHSPLLPELLEWKIVDSRVEQERLIVRIVIVRISTLDDIMAGFLDHGLAVPPVYAELDGEHAVLLRGAKRDTTRPPMPKPWRTAAAIFVSTPLCILVVLHILVLDQRSKVAEVEELARPKLAAERRLRNKAEVGIALKAVLRHPSVTATIEDLSARLPASVHAIDVTAADGGGLDFTLQTPTPEVVLPRLAKDPLVSGVRETGRNKASDGTIQTHYTVAAQ